MTESDGREKNRIERRDKAAHKKAYAPRTGGLPMGKPKSYWVQRSLAK